MPKTNGFKPMKYEVHPIAALLPLLNKEQYAELKADIQERGIREPIIMQGSVLIDGRNRMQACEELEIEPPVKQYTGKDVEAEIISRNAFRRHLTDEQRLMFIANALAPKLRKEAEERMKSGTKATTSDEPARVVDVISDQAKTGERRAQQAIDIVEHGTKADIKSVISGKERLADVAREVRQKQQAKDIKSGKVKKPKAAPKVDMLDSKYIIKRFQSKFLDHWAVTQHRKVKEVVKGFLSEK